MRGLFEAVAYIHNRGIAHRDLKPGKDSFITLPLDNILLGNKNDMSSVKVADFGLSSKYNTLAYTQLQECCGTLIFMAPEVVRKKDYSKVRMPF